MENELNTGLELLPETNAIVKSVEDRSNRKVVVLADQNVASRSRAVYVVTDQERHQVRYDPSERVHLDHLIAHEMGHARHFIEAPPEDRLVPVVTGENRQNALKQLTPDLAGLIANGHSTKKLSEALPFWRDGIVSQLSNTPPDIRIEQWIYEEYPGLRKKQEQSISSDIEKLHGVLAPRIEEVTPRSVWLASNAINYVYAESMAKLFKNNTFVHPYINIGKSIYSLGKELTEIMDDQADGTLAGDNRVTDAWAEKLGFKNWFEWRKVDEIHVNSKTDGVAIE